MNTTIQTHHWLFEKGANAEFSFAKYREGSLEYANDIPKMNPNDDNLFYDA